MGQRTEELTHDIEQTRGSLARDLDELQDKVSPSATMERRKSAARQRVQGMRDKVMGTASSAGGSVQDGVSGTAQQAADTARGVAGSAGDRFDGSPLAAGLVAFGAGLVVSAMLPASAKETQAAGRLVQTAKEQAQPLVEEARSVAQDLGQDLAAKAGEAAQEVKETATESVSRVQEEGTSAAEAVKDDVQGGS